MALNEGVSQNQTENDVQLVQFKLGGEFFGVKVEQVREIVKFSSVTHVPKMPAFIDGVMNLRGQITTIIDLRRRLDISDNGGRTPESRIIVAEIGSSQVGIIVDSVRDVIRVSSEKISLPHDVITSRVDTQFLTGICRLKEDLMMILELGNIVTAEELEGLEGMEKFDNFDVNFELQQEKEV